MGRRVLKVSETDKVWSPDKVWGYDIWKNILEHCISEEIYEKFIIEICCIINRLNVIECVFECFHQDRKQVVDKK